MATRQILSAITETKHTVESFAVRLASIRYDLVGSTPNEKDSPNTPARPPMASDDSAFDYAVEYIYGDINKALNTINIELDHLRAAVDHKQSNLSHPINVLRTPETVFTDGPAQRR